MHICVRASPEEKMGCDTIGPTRRVFSQPVDPWKSAEFITQGRGRSIS